MTYLLTLTPKLLGLTAIENAVQQPPQWILQARCEENTANSCLFLQQLVELSKSNGRDGKDALLAMKKLFDVAKTGLPLTQFYDTKQCHEAHTFSVSGIEHKVWRIRKNNVRIYFYYSEGKVIYLTATKAKRADKLKSGELKQLKDEVLLYLQAKEQGLLEVITVN